MEAVPLILASTSPRRADLLREYGHTFLTVPTSVQELQDPSAIPRDLVLQNALRKASAVAPTYQSHIVIGADTVVSIDGRILGKPATWEEAEAMLKLLNGRSHEVFTGVCLIHLGSNRRKTFVESTQVSFHDRTESERRSYLQRIQPMDKAGAYAAQDDQGHMIAHFRGSFTNVIGLPMESLHEALRDWGFPSPSSLPGA